jgi:phosphatidylglycerophosphatase C
VSALQPGRLLAVFDLDGTISRHDTMMPFVFGWWWRRPWRWLRMLGALPTMAAFAGGRADRGALKGALLRYTLGGLQRTVVERWAQRYVDALIPSGLFADALARVRAHREAGDYLVLMSASVDCYVPLIARALGFDECVCSVVLWRTDGRLDGRLAGANCRGEEKSRQLVAMRERLQPASVIAYGNSSADLPHLRLADRAVYVNGGSDAVSVPHLVRVQWR